MKSLAKDESFMASHFYKFIKIQDHFGVNVTIWKMIITSEMSAAETACAPDQN